jgi:hypothetical protein
LRFHLTAIFALGPLATASFIHSNHGLGDSELFAAKTMVALAIITGIGKHSLENGSLC